ncbi:hypothetical protein [Staphylococcus equorum]|uniref:Uncharacterized protein n=1 Tax=Staphylococcus equorum TaxID=246432 RepID=A0A9X4R5C8_9STAP|nr:hypothetical protein [Staphylococcus equorum]MDG0860368.1 hypothetical protein [Staphylococcus equorum]
MKKLTAHGLKIDRRKSMISNLNDNGIERKLTEGSSSIKIRESKVRRLTRKLKGLEDKKETTQREIEIVQQLLEKTQKELAELITKVEK